MLICLIRKRYARNIDDTKMIADVLKAMLRFKNELLAEG